MHSSSSSGSFARSAHRGSRVFNVLGVVALFLIFGVIWNMFSSRGVHSEEAEIIERAISTAHQTMSLEWITAEARFKDWPANGILIERTKLYNLYRLRVMVIATETEVASLSSLLESLVAADYSGQCFPVDVEVHILGKVAGLPHITWKHGRYNVYAHRLHGNANPSLPFFITDIWQPQSNFELGVPLTATAVLSRYWFQWLLQVIRQYAPPSNENSIRLEPAAKGSLLRSPLSSSMSGLALGPPVAGAAGNARTAVRATVPSTTTVFTADYWQALLEKLGTGVDLDDVATTSWRSFLTAAAGLLRTTVPTFLYPPLGKSGALACDLAGGDAAAQCNVAADLNTAALGELLHLPPARELIPRMQEQGL